MIGVIVVVSARSVTQSRAVVAGLGPRRSVAIATRDLVPGRTIGPDDVRWEQWPVAIATHFPTVDALTEAVVRAPVSTGAPITSEQIFGSNDPFTADERAVTVPVPLAPPPLDTGDIVEIIGLRPGPSVGDRQLIDTQALGRGRVVAVGDSGITLAVDVDRAVAIVETAAVGSIELVVTPFGS
ncbi:MAG: SAF domain-containing protein [Acidimicrobiales bacterium]